MQLLIDRGRQKMGKKQHQKDKMYVTGDPRRDALCRKLLILLREAFLVSSKQLTGRLNGTTVGPWATVDLIVHRPGRGTLEL